VANELFRMFPVWSLVWEAEAWSCRGEVDVVLTAGPSLAEVGIVQSYLQTTLVLIFIVPQSRLLFLPAVTSGKREAIETVG